MPYNVAMSLAEVLTQPDDVPLDRFGVRIAIIRAEKGWNYAQAEAATGVPGQNWRPCERSTYRRASRPCGRASSLSSWPFPGRWRFVMRKTLLLVGLVLGCLGVMAPSCQPTEPAMTITAAPDAAYACSDNAYLEGTVAPFAATKKVILQRTVSGKWVDWSWRSGNFDPTQGQVSATVEQWGEGRFLMNWWVPNSTTTLHLRVRSEGGGYVSNGFYVKPVC